jgi:D-alanyl-D-alanine carboxypeptidase
VNKEKDYSKSEDWLMSSHKDERFDTREGRAYRAQRPRTLARKEQSPREDFYSDEHPEVPKVLRASLHLDPHLATNASEIEKGRVRRVSPPVLPLPSMHPPSRNGGQTPLKSLPRRYKRQTLSPFTFLPQLAQRQNLLTIGGFAIALILVFALISSLLHNLFPQAPGITFIPPTNITVGDTNTDDPESINPHAQVNSDHPAPPVYAQAAYLLDADTGATLYTYNPSTHLPIMSTTKLMTALLAVTHGDLDQTVTINDQIANDISQLPADSANINVKKGESYSLRQMMYGLLLASGNDAAIAIADTIGGTLSNFLIMMNEEAATLELHDTHFENPDGLQQPNHYSSAHDLAILGLHSLSNPMVHQISGTLNYHIDQTAQHAAHDFFNGNQFIWWYPGVDAGKPGYDAATNFVQVISCVRNGHHLIGVVIHTIDWWTDMRNLMNWGFNTYTWLSLHDLNTAAHPIPYANLWDNFNRDKKENTVPTADHGRYYIYTGYSITGDIENYFDKNGGLTSFGFPTSQPWSSGRDTLIQRFEHSAIQCNIQSKKCQRST